jgi:sugar-phosphatase
MPQTLIDCDAVLFDMDGTLVDSKAIVERMWLHWAAENGLAPEAVLAVAHGRRTLETMQMVAPQLATPEEAARLDAFEAEQEGGETAVPGAAALLAALPRGRWAVVTSAVRSIATTRMAVVGLPLPATLVPAEDVANGKPAPDGYLRAAALLGVAPERCVVIEDTPAGAEAGRSAGAFVIGLQTTFRTVAHSHIVVPDLRAVQIGAALAPAALRLVVHTP